MHVHDLPNSSFTCLILCSDSVFMTTCPCNVEINLLAMCFGDTNVDKDGMINAAEFDSLCEDIAPWPRRFGLTHFSGVEES